MYTGNVLTPRKAPESAKVEQRRLRTFTSQWLTQSESVARAGGEGAHTHTHTGAKTQLDYCLSLAAYAPIH